MTKTLAAGLLAIALSASACGTIAAADLERRLYAIGEAPADRGALRVYDIDAGHRLVKTIRTIADTGDVRGVAASAATGMLYVAYTDKTGAGRIYCLDLYGDAIRWDRKVDPGVDRLAISPDGKMLYVPTGEQGTAGFIEILDARNGTAVRRVYFSRRSHDAQYPLSGPLFQSTKAEDGSGRYLYRIDPRSYAVSRVGPYTGVLGPYAVDGESRFVADDVTGLWGMEVADLETGRIVTATLPHHPPGRAHLMHGIGWTPDEREVWQSSSGGDPHLYIWNMREPMAPVFERTLALRSGRGSHWLSFDIAGDDAYAAPEKDGEDGTEIFDTRTYAFVGTIAASEDFIEIDYMNGRVSAVGDQYGIGRR